MKRNFDAPMLDFEGKPYTDGTTLKMVAFGALHMQVEGDQHLSKVQKWDIYLLALKIAGGGVIDFEDPKDLALIEDRIAKCWPPLVMGEAFRLLRTELPQEDAAAPAGA